MHYKFPELQTIQIQKKTELNFYFIMYSILIRQEKIIIKYMAYFYRVTAPTFAQSIFSCNFRSLPSADMLSDLRSERNLSLLHTHTHVPTHTHYRSACDIWKSGGVISPETQKYIFQILEVNRVTWTRASLIASPRLCKSIFSLLVLLLIKSH